MLRVTIIKLIEYLLMLVDIIDKNKVANSKYKSIRKSGNKIVEILAKLKH